MSLFLSHIQADLRRTLLTRRGATHRAEDVPRGTHKSYPRMEQVPLPEPSALGATLADALKSRQSDFGNNPRASFSLQECGTLFGLALRKRPDSMSRNYPSGGALYPIETYVLSTTLESQSPSAFHYNPTTHTLERLWGLPDDFSMRETTRYLESIDVSMLVVFTSVWQRSSAKYGDLAYQHALIEAGHMSQNVLLVATALGLKTRPFAGFNDEYLGTLFDLDDEVEQVVHTITVSKASGS